MCRKQPRSCNVWLQRTINAWERTTRAGGSRLGAVLMSLALVQILCHGMCSRWMKMSRWVCAEIWVPIGRGSADRHNLSGLTRGGYGYSVATE